MKRLLACLLLIALCLGAVACGDTIDSGSETTVGETTAVETTLPSASSESEESEELAKDTSDTAESEDMGDESLNSDGSETDTATESYESGSGSSAETAQNGAADGGKESEVSEEIETEDVRLSAEYAPITYFDAKAIYELTRDGVYEDLPSHFLGYDEVTYHKEKGQRPYVRLKTWNDMLTAAEAYISLCTKPMEVAPCFAVKYRTQTPGITMEVYTDSVNNGVTPGNIVRIPVTSDGEWHVEYVNLTKIKQFNGQTVNYFRFDFMNASKLPKDAYVDFEYVAFFNSEDEVEMFETGKYVPVIYVDPNSGYTDATNTIVHASSIDMINGAGGIGAGKFDYRGGNSASGVDKFNHNSTTLGGGKLVFSGWTVVEGGIEKFVWSIDGLNWYDATPHQMGGLGDLGNAHLEATQSYTGATIVDVDNSLKGGGYAGAVNLEKPEDRAKGLACELLKVAKVGDKVNVRFAAVPKSDTTKLCLIAYVKGVTVVSEIIYEEETEYVETFAPEQVEPSECEEHNTSVYWYPVPETSTEQKLCLLCGTSLEIRDIGFAFSIDNVVHKDGTLATPNAYGSQAIRIDGSSLTPKADLSISFNGWFAVTSGVAKYVYKIDNGAWTDCGAQPNKDSVLSKDIIESINKELGLSDYKKPGRFNGIFVSLLEYAEKTVNVTLAAVPNNNADAIVVFAEIANVTVPQNTSSEPEEEIKFIKAINDLTIGGVNVHNPSGGYGGELFTYDATDITMTGFTVKWAGWAGVNDGFSKWVYSVDGGVTWKDVSGSAGNTTDTGILSALSGAGITNATAKGTLGIIADLSTVTTATAEVIFAAVPNSDTEKIIPMVKIININLPDECTHASVISWTPVAGELKESGACARCGETITRNVKFLNNIDIIEGSKDGAKYEMNPPDGVDLVSSPEEILISRVGKDIVVQGWLAVNGGVQKYVYSIDGGNTWLDCGNQPNYKDATFASSQDHINAINGASLGFTAEDADVNGRYRVTCDLSSKASETVTVIFGAILEENQTAAPLQLLVVTVNVLGTPASSEPEETTTESEETTTESEETTTESEETTTESEETTTESEVTEPEEEIKFIKAINDLTIGGVNVHNPSGGYGGELFTYDATDITMTGFTVKWAGWAGVNDGFSKWVYSVDGGNTWKDVSGSVGNTTDSNIINVLTAGGLTNATAKGTIGIIADLSTVTTATAEVIFAAVPNSDTEKIIPMVKIINIKLPDECTHPSVISWMPVAGELKESGACARCGETVTRDTTFVICLDKVYYDGGTRGWAANVAQSTPYVVNNVASMPIRTNGLGVQGWVALNGGVSKYMWSVDGVTWQDAGTGEYSNAAIINEVNKYNTGIDNFTSQCQFNLNLTGLCSLDAGTYTVYFGAVPANNTGVIVPIAQIENVVVK